MHPKNTTRTQWIGRHEEERYVGNDLRSHIVASGNHMLGIEQMLGLSGGYVCRVAKGERTTDRRTAERICALIGVPFDVAFCLSKRTQLLIERFGLPAATDGEFARFWRKVQRGEGCWIWLRSRNTNGYGQFMLNGQPRLAHRVAWELTHGAIPDGLDVCHHCDNPPCVRPDHLFLGTERENMGDMTRKGRAAKPGSKLSAEQVASIRAELATGVKSQRAIARIYGVSQSTIFRIKVGTIWR